MRRKELVGISAILKALRQWHRHAGKDAERKRFNRLRKSGELDAYLKAEAIWRTAGKWYGDRDRIEQLRYLPQSSIETHSEAPQDLSDVSVESCVYDDYCQFGLGG